MIRPMTRIPAIGTFLLWFLSIGVALASARFLMDPPEIGLAHMAHHLTGNRTLLLVHVYASPVALALMPAQFWQGLRDRRPGVHRMVGRAYGLAVLVGGLSGLLIAPGASGGAVGQAGFLALAVLWLGFTGWGIRCAMAGDLDAHRRFMLRSAALTFAAVTLRLYLPVLFARFDFQTVFLIVAWMCWVPNLIVMEWVIRRQAARRSPVPA